MKAIVLVRTSTEEQDLGLAAQHAQVDAFAARERIDIVDRVTVKHGSASEEHYTLLASLLSRCKAGGLVLLVAKTDRYGRSYKAMAMLEDSGVRLVVAELGLAAGDLVIGMLAVMAKEERRLISARTKAALNALKAKGVKLGTHREGCDASAMAARSWENRPSAADLSPERVAILREALAGGRSYRAASAWLNERSIPTPTGEGTWFPMTLQRCAKCLAIR